MSYVYPPVAPRPAGAPTSLAATNTKAVVALCTAFSLPPLALVFGILARREMARTGEGGSGFATTGIVLGLLWAVLVVLYVLFFVVLVVLGGASGF
ncbi:DUF4190 domain-containing protein [Pseudokineococcus lusitanus]|uniref:Uncharacterized protein DUF4190 n=1 Tax=Pseudokineococcus lusitanus TaxID=763993 RepID=A0A3N1GWI1_9ACTN|nr:DUF4190 domain-containing protein [Pseudokineococcus lusitanus]ROP34516.1 uncharacterized protein DUF4190 [Pseudokineococcus lusitanus]